MNFCAILHSRSGQSANCLNAGSVSEACKVMGYSRDSFYRLKELYEKGGELALKEISRRKPCIKDRVEADIEQTIMELAMEQPAFGQVRIANELTKCGLSYRPWVCAACGCGLIYRRLPND